MLKDGFDSSEHELSQNKTWVSLFSGEKSFGHKRVEASPPEHVREISFSSSILSHHVEIVESENLEPTKTSIYCPRRVLSIYEDGIQRQHILNDGTLTVGRGKENHIVILDPMASRKHFALEIKPDLVEFIDLSSENGTKVNGVVTHKCELKNGDSISVGKTIFIFQNDEDSQDCLNQNQVYVDLKNDAEKSVQIESLNKNNSSVIIETSREEKSTSANRFFLEKLKRLCFTIGIILFFTTITIFLVLGGAMVSRVFQEEQIRQLVFFYEKLGEASRLAGFGDVQKAELIMKEIQHFSRDGGTQMKFYKDTQNFIEAMDKLKKTEKHAMHLDFPAVEEKKQRSMKMISASKPLRLDEKWKQAISLYGSGYKKEACDLVKDISLKAKEANPLFLKTQSFLERKCF